MRTRSLSLALLAVGLALPAARAAEKVTLDDLLKQMTDLSKLAEYPDPPYVTKQFSSYDRASETPGNENWFANADRGFMLYDGVVKDKTPYFKTAQCGKVRKTAPSPPARKSASRPTHKPVGGYVWAYATGPDGRPIDGKTPQGYIDRERLHARSAGPRPGRDGRPRLPWCASGRPTPTTPAKSASTSTRRRNPSSRRRWRSCWAASGRRRSTAKDWTPFPDPIACERSRGFNLYFPIAYAKHCKIIIDKPDIYYHVDYRTYPKGTEVETFTLRGLVPRGQWDPRSDFHAAAESDGEAGDGSSEAAFPKLPPESAC